MVQGRALESAKAWLRNGVPVTLRGAYANYNNEQYIKVVHLFGEPATTEPTAAAA